MRRNVAPRNAGNHVRELIELLPGVAGCFLFYLAIFGAAGFAVTRPFTPFPSCVPFHVQYGLIDATCRIAAVNMFWSGTLAFPRFLLLFPALIVTFAKMGWQHWRDAAQMLLYSVPLAAVITVGVRFWGRRLWLPATIAVVAILAEIVALGLTE